MTTCRCCTASIRRKTRVRTCRPGCLLQTSSARSSRCSTPHPTSGSIKPRSRVAATVSSRRHRRLDIQLRHAMPNRNFKDTIYEQLSRLGKAVSAPKRLELLDLLCQGPRTVEALAEHASLSVANASQHLQVLRAARLVDAEKKGLYVEYRLAGDDVCRFYLGLRNLGEARLAEIAHVTREFLGARDAMETVAGDELLRRVKKGEVTVLDVR